MTFKKKRIMIVDDEVVLTKLLKLNLEGTGRYVVQVENRGTSALAAAKLFKPDLIFLDIVMPDAEGSQVAADLRSDPGLRDTPIVFLTATVSADEVGGSNGVIGGHPFIAKPATVEQLEDCIRQYT